MKFSRRRLAGLAAPVLVARAVTPVKAQTAAASPADPEKAVRDANLQNSETLAKFEVPVATEPAFQFRA